MMLLSGNIRFIWIFAGVPLGEGIKRQWSHQQQQFLAFSLATSSETLEIRPELFYSDTQSLTGFSVIPKCMTLHGYFTLNSVFVPILLASETATFESNCVKTNKDLTHTVSGRNVQSIF